MIRPATVADLAQLERLAHAFVSATQFSPGFEMDRFVQAWSSLLAGPGVIFLSEEAGHIRGAIGGVLYPDLYSARLIATEFFWFVDPAQRGAGLRLYHAFEGWARQNGAHALRMVHLLDSMPERLQRVYQRLGFAAAEIHYSKELT